MAQPKASAHEPLGFRTPLPRRRSPIFTARRIGASDQGVHIIIRTRVFPVRGDVGNNPRPQFRQELLVGRLRKSGLRAVQRRATFEAEQPVRFNKLIAGGALHFSAKSHEEERLRDGGGFSALEI